MEGLSLTALVEDARQVGRRHAMPLVVLIEVFHKAAVQIARAHDRLVLHGNLDPDKLLVGRFGEVVITDWSSNRQTCATSKPWTGVSAGGRLGPEDDLYALCACMWYALHLEPPAEGDLRPSDKLPPAVRDLLLRGLSPQHSIRFRDAHRLTTAIRALAPVGYRFDSEGALSTYRRRTAWIAGWIFAISLLAAAIVSVIVVVRPLTASRPVEHRPAPILQESFTDESWRGRWKPRGDPDQFTVTDGALVNRTESAILVLDRLIAPPATMEFVGEIPAGSDPGDLSVVWGEGSLLDPLWTFPHAAKLPDKGRFYLFQNGAYDNTYSCIQQSADGILASVAYQHERLDIGRRYRIRVEIESRSVAMWRDGRLIGRHEFDVALRPGTFALYLYHPGKQVRDVRVWSGEPMADPLQVGDAFLGVGAASAAADSYMGVIQSGRQPQLVESARYRLGLAQLAAGEREASVATWSGLRDPVLAGRSRLQQLDALIAAGAHDAALAILEDVYVRIPDLRGQVAVRLAAILGRVTWDQRFDDYVQLRERLLANDDITGISAARYLGWRNRHERVVARYSKYRAIYLDSLFALGDLDRAERDGSDIPSVNVRLALERGQFELLASRPVGHVLASCLLGRFDAAAAASPGDPLPLLYAGRFAEAAASVGPERLVTLARRWMSGSSGPELRIGTERLDALVRSAFDAGRDGWCDARLGAEALLRGRIEGRAADEQSKLLVMLSNSKARQEDPLVWFHHLVVPAYLQALDGHPEALDDAVAKVSYRYRDRYGQRFWYFAQRVCGLVDEGAFMAQPARVEAQAWLALADAMAADRRGDRSAAFAYWRSLAAMPPHRRCFGGIEGSRVADVLIAWRSSP
ncbi:MAG: hypothetical protein J0M02_00255 [Planctomycetes bacterium]|nr:hypothetical protein [Planctomycetota bacterium]